MTTTHRYFDLIDFVSRINEVYVGAQVMQSVARRMDTLITTKTRQLLREVRDAAIQRGDADSYNDTAEQLRGLNVGEEWFAATGLDRGVIEEIVRLTALRGYAHERASELTALTTDWQGRPRRYEAPDLEDVFRSEPSTKVSSQVKSRIDMSSKGLADAYGIDVNILRERRLAAQQRQAQDRAAAVMETADLAWWCYTTALRSQPTELEAMKRDLTIVTQQRALEEGFPCLQPETQVALIKGAQQAADRAMSFAENERSLTDAEFARILACSIKVQKELDTALTAPKLAATV